jgi:hypothetical protein
MPPLLLGCTRAGGADATVGNSSARRSCSWARACSRFSTATRRSRLWASANLRSAASAAHPGRNPARPDRARRALPSAAGPCQGNCAATGALRPLVGRRIRLPQPASSSRPPVRWSRRGLAARAWRAAAVGAGDVGKGFGFMGCARCRWSGAAPVALAIFVGVHAALPLAALEDAPHHDEEDRHEEHRQHGGRQHADITPVPIARWLAEPAPLASTSGNTPRMKAIEVMMMGRKRRWAASSTASTSACAPGLQVLGELDDQHRVLGAQADDGDQARH